MIYAYCEWTIEHIIFFFSICNGSGSFDAECNEHADNDLSPPIDLTIAGEWIVNEGEFGTAHYRSLWNLPEGTALPISKPIELTLETGISSITCFLLTLNVLWNNNLYNSESRKRCACFSD